MPSRSCDEYPFHEDVDEYPLDEDFTEDRQPSFQPDPSYIPPGCDLHALICWYLERCYAHDFFNKHFGYFDWWAERRDRERFSELYRYLDEAEAEKALSHVRAEEKRKREADLERVDECWGQMVCRNRRSPCPKCISAEGRETI